MRPLRRPPDGFTVIELIAVVGLAAILSAIALPRFSPANREGAARIVATEIRAARNLALNRGIAVSLAITGSTGYVDPFGRPADLADLAPGATFVGLPRFSFNPAGEPTGDLVGYVADREGSAPIVITPVTGSVTP